MTGMQASVKKDNMETGYGGIFQFMAPICQGQYIKAGVHIDRGTDGKSGFRLVEADR